MYGFTPIIWIAESCDHYFCCPCYNCFFGRCVAVIIPILWNENAFYLFYSRMWRMKDVKSVVLLPLLLLSCIIAVIADALWFPTVMIVVWLEIGQKLWLCCKNFILICFFMFMICISFLVTIWRRSSIMALIAASSLTHGRIVEEFIR